MKSHYLRWKESWGRDGPDDSILFEATGEVRAELEGDLISNLGESEAWALAQLGSTKAVPHLKRRLEFCSGLEKAAYGSALIRITGDYDHIEAITSVLFDTDTTSSSDRVSAVRYLTYCRHPHAFDALERAMYDADFLVRYNAALVFSNNSDTRADEKAIVEGVSSLDEERIRKFAEHLRSKIKRDSGASSLD